MSPRVVCIGLLVGTLLTSVALGTDVRCELFTGSHVVVVDSVVFDGAVYYPDGWSGDSMVYDTTIISVLGQFPRLLRLYATADGSLLPLRPPALEPDTWYTFGLSPTDAQVRFSVVPSGLEGENAIARPLSVRALRNPTAGPVRLNASLPAGVVPGVEVYNGAGVLVRSINGLVWDRRDIGGKSVAAGLYLLRVTAGNQRGIIKVILTD